MTIRATQSSVPSPQSSVLSPQSSAPSPQSSVLSPRLVELPAREGEDGVQHPLGQAARVRVLATRVVRSDQDGQAWPEPVASAVGEREPGEPVAALAEGSQEAVEG